MAGRVVLLNLSGRGDKDVATASRWMGHLAGEAAQAIATQAVATPAEATP